MVAVDQFLKFVDLFQTWLGSPIGGRGRKSLRRVDWMGGPGTKVSLFPWLAQGLPFSLTWWKLRQSGLRACWMPLLL